MAWIWRSKGRGFLDGHSRSSILACLIYSKTSFDMFFKSLFCWNNCFKYQLPTFFFFEIDKMPEDTRPELFFFSPPLNPYAHGQPIFIPIILSDPLACLIYSQGVLCFQCTLTLWFIAFLRWVCHSWLMLCQHAGLLLERGIFQST